jgi:hypothetical protein
VNVGILARRGGGGKEHGGEEPEARSQKLENAGPL